MPISRYVVQRIIERDAEKEESVLPTGVARRVARDMLVLARIQELRFEEAGAREDWLKLLEEADAILDGWCTTPTGSTSRASPCERGRSGPSRTTDPETLNLERRHDRTRASTPTTALRLLSATPHGKTSLPSAASDRGRQAGHE